MPRAADPGWTDRVARLAVLAASVLALILVPLLALQRGWLPADDATRHAAFATVNREWKDIVVLRPEAERDQHELWHDVLRLAHRATGAAPQGLVVLSVIALAWAFGVVPLAFIERPEAWVAALGLVSIGEPLFASRWMCGRPLVAAMTALVVVAAVFTRDGMQARRRMALGIVAIALGAGLHGSWYLFALPVAAFAITGPLRRAVELGSCWLAGSVLGACATGEPVTALVSPLKHLQLTLLAGSPAPWKVAELQPGSGALACIGITVVALLARLQWRRAAPRPWRDPVLVLAALSWAAGLLVQRLWLDWGVPALACWLAFEVQAHVQARAASPARRAGAALGACVLLLLATGADRGGRWSGSLASTPLPVEDAALASWLPEPGGIVFNERMSDFYSSFLEHPEAPWRYQLGYEPALMPPQDLEVYRGIQRSGYDTAAFRPWAARMTRRDRMLLHWPFTIAPPLPELEWRRAQGDLWLGRKPQAGSAP